MRFANELAAFTNGQAVLGALKRGDAQRKKQVQAVSGGTSLTRGVRRPRARWAWSNGTQSKTLMQTVQTAAARSKRIHHAPSAPAAASVRPICRAVRRFSLLARRGVDGVVRAGGSLTAPNKQQKPKQQQLLLGHSSVCRGFDGSGAMNVDR